MLQLLPAIDVVDGQAVRLHQGQAGTETTYGQPLELAHRFAQAGAQWLHLVDLDAAFGRGANTALLERISAEVEISVEVSGGIRDEASLARALNAGAKRVNLGTAAIENPDWCDDAISRWGEAIAVGLDVRGTTLASRGWTESGPDLFDVLERLDRAGCARYVVTDVSRDGTMNGPNLELLRRVCAHTPAPVVASGGIASLADIEALASLVAEGVEGAIIGKALYAGAFTLPQALEVANGR